MNEISASALRILLIEDDEQISRLIRDSLRKEYFEISCAFDGRTGLDMFAGSKYHLVITDLMLPVMDGYEVVKRIREKSMVPIIILSVKDSEAEKIVGIRLGADDYVTKPFSVPELVERVKGHLRRFLDWGGASIETEQAKVLTHGILSLNLEEYKAHVEGKEIVLTYKEFEILKLLIEKPGMVYTKDQIYQKVWGTEYYLDANTINVHIRRLREKLEPDPSKPQIIETVWGIGYKLR